VDFSGANRESAILSGAHLEGANFTGAKLVHADFRGTDLRHTKGLSSDQIKKAMVDASTKLPDFKSGTEVNESTRDYYSRGLSSTPRECSTLSPTSSSGGVWHGPTAEQLLKRMQKQMENEADKKK
jgi:Pentapeptide repeats (8 copies)